MNREEALKSASRAQIGILIGMGALLWASLNTTRAIRYFEGVIPRDEVLVESSASPQDTKEALENMVEAYSQNVN